MISKTKEHILNIDIIDPPNKLLYGLRDNTPQDIVLRRVSQCLDVFSNSIQSKADINRNFPYTLR